MAVLAFYCSFENIKQSKSACFVAQPEKGREEVTLNDEIFPVFQRRIFRSGGWRRAKSFEENGKWNGKFIDLIYGFKREVNFSVEFRIESFEVKHEEVFGMLVTFHFSVNPYSRNISKNNFLPAKTATLHSWMIPNFFKNSKLFHFFFL